MLTGLRALDTNRPAGEHNLVEWARPSLAEKKKLKKIMDPRLADKYPLKGACQAAELITKCLESDPKSRPSMEEILETLQKINAIKEKPTKETKKSKDTRSATTTRHLNEHSSHQRYHNRSPIHQNHGANAPSAAPRPYKP